MAAGGTAGGAAGRGGGSGRCPACGGTRLRARWPMPGEGTEGGVDARAFRPSSDRFGTALSTVLGCLTCGHGSLAEPADPAAVADAYEDAADPVSVREEPGQQETARRALELIEQHAAPARLLDVGCWTGSFVAAASERGWTAEGIEPSGWAVERARQRGVAVRQASLGTTDLEAGSYRAVVCCDVLEHLADPGSALEELAALLEPGGILYLTVPDAGSRLARVMRRRWWSVLPMHLQYFTRTSMALLLEGRGFDVLAVRTHAKVFSGRYYAERLGAFAPVGGRAVERAATHLLGEHRLIAPDLRDRMAVIARLP